MHGIFDSLLGGGHDLVSHDTHLHDVVEETPLLALGAAEGAMQIFHLGAHLTHALHDTTHLTDAHHPRHDSHAHTADHDTHNPRGWQDVGSAGSPPHLHLLRHSEAHDSNGDGISDAASKDLGLDPYAHNPHSSVHVDWHDASGHLHHSHGKDSDGDGWPDDIERMIGTDPHNAASHPSLVEAHHYPAGSDENLPGTMDVTPSTTLWI